MKKSGSWKTPFLFIWRILAKPLVKLGNSIIEPSERAKVRWSFLGILILVIGSAITVYPQGYNKIVGEVNELIVSTGYRLDLRNEKAFNLGLDLQGGAHLVYQANLADANTDDEEEALAILRDRIERRVNSLGVSEPLVQVAGKDRLVVELAGVNVNDAIDQIGETPLLEFREKNTDPPRGLTPEERDELESFNDTQLNKAEAAFNRVNSGQEAIEDVAKEVSDDEATKNSGGDLGVITRANNPELYTALEDTLIGRVKNSIIEASNGYYIARVDDRQEAGQEMLLSHILICYEGSAQCQDGPSREEALNIISAIRSDITVGNFEEKAVEFSTDPSVTENRGDLDWVAPGAVVESFEQPALALEIGTISEPIETDFGFHLIYKRDQRAAIETSVSAIFFEKKVEQDFLPESQEWKNTGLTGNQIEDAQIVFAAQTNAPQVSIQFDSEGTELFSALTKQYLGQEIAIFLDGQAISIPTVQQPITDGQAVISGSFTVEEARDLARRLKDGALPVTIELVQQQTVGASLGADSLAKSLKAGLLGLIVVAIFMILYYRIPGLMAVFALAAYGVLTLAIFKLIGVTLTLSGIAGFVLSIGMAVDANVLVFERFREERKDGKDLEDSIRLAFEKAWSSIRDGNVSTLITCFILGSFGTSLVQGFAVTLAIGILVSMFSAIVITKTFLKLITGWKFVKKLLFFYGAGIRLKG